MAPSRPPAPPAAPAAARPFDSPALPGRTAALLMAALVGACSPGATVDDDAAGQASGTTLPTSLGSGAPAAEQGSAPSAGSAPAEASAPEIEAPPVEPPPPVLPAYGLPAEPAEPTTAQPPYGATPPPQSPPPPSHPTIQPYGAPPMRVPPEVEPLPEEGSANPTEASAEVPGPAPSLELETVGAYGMPPSDGPSLRGAPEVAPPGDE